MQIADGLSIYNGVTLSSAVTYIPRAQAAPEGDVEGVEGGLLGREVTAAVHARRS
jgi:hypothetical protein